MTLTLTLSPDRETRLQEQASRAGLPLDEYALRVLDEAAVVGTVKGMTPEQKAADFLAWSQAQNPAVPPLPPEATTREALYAEDEAAEDQRAA